MPDRYRVDLSYRLVGPFGRSPTRTWFFDLPAPPGRTAPPHLLRRQRAHAPTGAPRRELAALDGRPVPVDAMPAWDGEATSAKAAAHLPWILASGATGAYDGMTGNDFSELMLYRALEEGRATDAQAREFTQPARR
jgi:hypothetical protein